MLNRCAVIVRPAQPFIDWVASLDDSSVLPDPEGERTVYLFPDLADGGDIDEMIAEAFDVIFENELDGWHTDEAAGPSPVRLRCSNSGSKSKSTRSSTIWAQTH